MIRPSFTLDIYRFNRREERMDLIRRAENLLAERPPASYIVAAFVGDGSGPWLPAPSATLETLPWSLRSAFERNGRGWKNGLGINVLEMGLWSTRNELIARLVARLHPFNPSAKETPNALH